MMHLVKFLGIPVCRELPDIEVEPAKPQRHPANQRVQPEPAEEMERDVRRRRSVYLVLQLLRALISDDCYVVPFCRLHHKVPADARLGAGIRLTGIRDK